MRDPLHTYPPTKALHRQAATHAAVCTCSATASCMNRRPDDETFMFRIQRHLLKSDGHHWGERCSPGKLCLCAAIFYCKTPPHETQPRVIIRHSRPGSKQPRTSDRHQRILNSLLLRIIRDSARTESLSLRSYVYDGGKNCERWWVVANSVVDTGTLPQALQKTALSRYTCWLAEECRTYKHIP